jgi:branched-subunit amino acid transport protein
VGDYWAYVVLTAGAAITYFWRGLGIAMAGRLRPNGRVMDWIGCVAYALLAGLISRMIVVPIGPLAETTLTVRLASVAIALAMFLALRRNVLLGVVAGATALVLLSG